MITQEFDQGKNKIKIENAESLEDAKKNNFQEGEYSRYYVNGKIVSNYMAMIRFIVDEVKQNKESLVPSGKSLPSLRKQMLENQNKEMINQVENLKKQYKDMGVSDEMLLKLDGMIDKIDITGVRNVK